MRQMQGVATQLYPLPDAIDYDRLLGSQSWAAAQLNLTEQHPHPRKGAGPTSWDSLMPVDSLTGKPSQAAEEHAKPEQPTRRL